jgi:peptide-methionine (R)-S-oxide reductase
MRNYLNYGVLGTIVFVVAGLAGAVVTSWTSDSNSPAPLSLSTVDKAKTKAPDSADNGDPWKAKLTEEQYRITRQKGTEAPFTGKYWDHEATGIYKCVCCGTKLFDSSAKFNSKTGWPSFHKPVNDQSIETAIDSSLYTARTEIICHKCKAHLGHVLDEGPKLCYCINSAALEFEGAEPRQKTGG